MRDKKSILVVDDNDLCLKNIASILEKSGYEVLTAMNGEKALTSIKENHFNLVITDIKMPGINGIDLLKIMRRIAPDVGVIVFSAYGNVSSYLEIMGLGAFEFLTKPIRLHELRRIVKKYFDISLVGKQKTSSGLRAPGTHVRQKDLDLP